MKYMLLIYTDVARWRTLTQAEKEDWLAEYITFTQKIIDTGEHLYGAHSRIGAIPTPSGCATGRSTSPKGR